jgi:hypothetical protein
MRARRCRTSSSPWRVNGPSCVNRYIFSFCSPQGHTSTWRKNVGKHGAGINYSRVSATDQTPRFIEPMLLQPIDVATLAPLCDPNLSASPSAAPKELDS